MIRTVLFDLDGTLADTAPDLGFAINALLKEEGRPALPYTAIRATASHGARGLIKLGFGVERNDPAFQPLRQRFLQLYADNLCTHTKLFPGVDHVIAHLRNKGLHWGIVTNKPAYLTDCLIKELGFAASAACVVSGDTTANSKPHPEPLLYGCAQAGGRADECLYVGDAERDIEAGRRAGMKTLVALFGYLHERDEPMRWGADGAVRAPEEIIDWIDAHG